MALVIQISPTNIESKVMKKIIAPLTILTLMLAACGGAVQPSAESVAQDFAAEQGYTDIEITEVSEGDAAARGADALYCVATNATDDSTGLPYLLVVWQSGENWEAAQLTEGYYEWDLQGCPR